MDIHTHCFDIFYGKSTHFTSIYVLFKFKYNNNNSFTL